MELLYLESQLTMSRYSRIVTVQKQLEQSDSPTRAVTVELLQ